MCRGRDIARGSRKEGRNTVMSEKNDGLLIYELDCGEGDCARAIDLNNDKQYILTDPKPLNTYWSISSKQRD
jgi:hypothetical protein